MLEHLQNFKEHLLIGHLTLFETSGFMVIFHTVDCQIIAHRIYNSERKTFLFCIFFKIWNNVGILLHVSHLQAR